MRRIVPKISMDLNRVDVDRIETRAAEILSTIGIEVNLPLSQERLAGHGEIGFSGLRVSFDRDFILELLNSLHQPTFSVDENHLTIQAGGGALNLFDHRTCEFRRPTTEDLLFCLRICDQLGLSGDPPVIPADIPMPLREVALYRMAWENTRFFNGRDITSVDTGQYIYEMAQVANKPFHIPLYMISPLKVNAENLALLIHFTDRLPSFSVSTMPMPGATAPLLAPGFLSQMLAEAIGGYALLKALFPGKAVSFGGKSVAFDPRRNAIQCGSPESLLQGQLEIALLSQYGISPTHFFWSMSAGSDSQSAAERMAGVLMSALAGVRAFGVAGRLQGEAFSLEQLLIDIEIAKYVERILSGQGWLDEELSLPELEEAIQGNTFLGSSSTVSYYRDEITTSRIFTRMTLAQRMEKGEASLRERIQDSIEHLDHPGKTYFSSEVTKEIHRIYHHAEEHLR